MSTVMGKQGVMAAVGALSGMFHGARFNSPIAGGFNSEMTMIKEPEFCVDRHISPALIQRRAAKVSSRKKKTNRLHLKKKAKVARRKAA